MAGVVKGTDGVRRCAGERARPTTWRTTTTSGAVRSSTTRVCTRSSASKAFRSGLSWLTILRKRENFRKAFEGFDADEGRPLRRARHRTAAWATRASCATAARSRRRSPTPRPIVACSEQHGSLAALCWSFEPKRTPAGAARVRAISRAKTAESKAASRRSCYARVPLRRADDGLRRDAVVRHRQRSLSGCAARTRVRGGRTSLYAASGLLDRARRPRRSRARPAARSGR